MEQAQDYSFNKSHAACYALIAYRTAYLKANYPAQYMAALVSSVMNTKDKVPIYVAACEEMGIEVLPPDVNASAAGFAVVEGKIRFGLNAVKNVGESAVVAIVAARSSSDGPFATLWDFCDRVDPAVVNKRALESLVKAGALDSTGHTRKGMLDVLEQALAWGGKQHADRLLGQVSLFDGGLPEAGVDQSSHHPRIGLDEFEKQELLAYEKEALGLYVSEHPLHAIRDQLRRKIDLPLVELGARRDGDIVTVGGIVGAIRQITNRKGDPMAFVRLDDLSGSTEVLVFNSALAAARDVLEPDRILLVKGRVDHKDGETKLVALEVAAFETAADPKDRVIRLRVDATRAPAGVIGKLAAVVRDFPGDARVVIDVELTEGARTYALGPAYSVRPVPDFFAEVKTLLGEAAVV
jgi:DNA polymerase-3 subunit alpha